MKFAELTPAQQESLQNSDNLLRKAMVASRVAIAAQKAYSLDYHAISGTSIESLDPGEPIPTTSGLTGAVSLPHEILTAVVAQFDGLIAAWDTLDVRKIHAQIVGAGNIEGIA